MISIPQRWRGIGYFIAAMTFFSAMNVMVRGMSGEMDPLQMVFIRNVLSFVMLLPFALRHGVEQLKTSRLPRHIIRAMFGLVAMESWFFALTYLSVNTATALSFTAPLFSTILAVLFLGEHIRWMRITALLTGFAGVLIIANPFSDAWNVWVVITLFSTAVMSASGIIVKTLTHSEPSYRIVLYMFGIMSIFSFFPALSVWQTPTMHAMQSLLIIGVLSTFAQLALTQALAHEQVVVLMPFEFIRLIFTAFFAWVTLGEVLTSSTLAGSAIIVSSTAFITWRESVRKRSIQRLEVSTHG